MSSLGIRTPFRPHQPWNTYVEDFLLGLVAQLKANNDHVAAALLLLALHIAESDDPEAIPRRDLRLTLLKALRDKHIASQQAPSLDVEVHRIVAAILAAPDKLFSSRILVPGPGNVGVPPIITPFLAAYNESLRSSVVTRGGQADSGGTLDVGAALALDATIETLVLDATFTLQEAIRGTLSEPMRAQFKPFLADVRQANTHGGSVPDLLAAIRRQCSDSASTPGRG